MAGFADREGKRTSSIVAGMISLPAEEAQRPEPPARPTAVESAAPVKRNTTLYMRDDVISDAKALAFIKKASLSNIVESALMDYIASNQELLETYKKFFDMA